MAQFDSPWYVYDEPFTTFDDSATPGQFSASIVADSLTLAGGERESLLAALPSHDLIGSRASRDSLSMLQDVAGAMVGSTSTVGSLE